MSHWTRLSGNVSGLTRIYVSGGKDETRLSTRIHRIAGDTEMKNCDCWIGILSDYNQSDMNYLTLGNVNEKLDERAAQSEAMGILGVFKPKDYIDGRRGLSTMFKFCPECGSKINWVKIRRTL